MSWTRRLLQDRWIWFAGGFVIVTSLIGRYLVGNVYSSAKAEQLINALADSGLYFGAAVATASATILALMLTLTGLTHKTEDNFDKGIYERINIIGLLSTVTLCTAIMLLMALSLPIGEFENIPENYYPVLYHVLVFLEAFLTGVLISTVLMLFTTIRRVVHNIQPKVQD